MKKPLQGLRVVAVEQFGAAPYGSMFLADLGAEVIKVENRTSSGDPARYVGPYLLGEADSEYFQTWNSNKKSILLDLHDDRDRTALIALISRADAVLNNLRGDKAAQVGLDYASLGKVKPSIVCVHLSAYGRDNERAARPGYDQLMQAESGMMSLTGDPDRPPTRTGAPSMIDHVTGLTAMVGLLSGVISARQTGIGCDIDTCLFDVALHQLGYVATWYRNHGYAPERQHRSAHFELTPVQTFPTADGYIFIMCMMDKFWIALANGLGRRDLADDPRFATAPARAENRTALTEIVDNILRRHPTQFWLDTLGDSLPVAPVLSLSQAIDSPFVQATRMIGEVDHPSGKLRILANPIKVNGERLSQTACPPMGADTKNVLTGIAHK